MKAEPLKAKPAFTPITITLETPQEVAAIFALLNHTKLAEAVRLLGMWQLIDRANEDAGNADIDYETNHRNLQALLK